MNKPIKSLIAATVLTAFVGLTFWPAYADELDDKYQELREISRQIEEKQKQLGQAERQEKSVIGQLRSLEYDINLTTSEINQLTGRLTIVERDIDLNEKELKKAEEALNTRTEVLNKRLKEIYLTGDVSYLEVLLESSSISDFLTRFDLLQRIVNQDMNLLKEIEDERHQIETKKADLEVRRSEMLTLRQDKANKNTYLAKQSQDKEKLLSSIKDQKEYVERELAAFEESSREVERIIREMEAKNPQAKPAATGKLIWPLPGYTRVSSDYGWRIHPILKTRSLHTGIDIPAPSGTAIKAAQSGTVLYTGLMGAYGNVVILSHGGNLSTMYAHQSAIAVSVGDEVKQGDKIGAVGSTGWSTGPHLHFEVRINGTHTNPWDYVSNK